MDTVIRLLPVELTADEFDAKAGEMAQLALTIASLTNEKKASASNYKSQLDTLAGQHSALAVIVNSRREYRDIECEQHLNIEKKIVEIVRMDTGEVVDQRGITSADIQETLNFPGYHEDAKEGKRKKGKSGDGDE